MTHFRNSQARAALEGLIPGLAPHMATRDALYMAVCELAQDHRMWGELAQQWNARRAPAVEPQKFDEAREGRELEEAGHA